MCRKYRSLLGSASGRGCLPRLAMNSWARARQVSESSGSLSAPPLALQNERIDGALRDGSSDITLQAVLTWTHRDRLLGASYCMAFDCRTIAKAGPRNGESWTRKASYLTSLFELCSAEHCRRATPQSPTNSNCSSLADFLMVIPALTAITLK